MDAEDYCASLLSHIDSLKKDITGTTGEDRAYLLIRLSWAAERLVKAARDAADNIGPGSRK